MKDFAGDYKKFIPGQARNSPPAEAAMKICNSHMQRAKLGDKVIDVPMVLATARMVDKEEQLRGLLACQEAEIDTSVPAPYRSFALKKVKEQFKERLAELKNATAAPTRTAEELPVLLVAAGKCESEAELRAMRKHQLKEIDDNVPKAYRGFARSVVEAHFKAKVQRLRQKAAAAAKAAKAASPAKASESSAAA